MCQLYLKHLVHLKQMFKIVFHFIKLLKCYSKIIMKYLQATKVLEPHRDSLRPEKTKKTYSNYTFCWLLSIQHSFQSVDLDDLPMLISEPVKNIVENV